MKNQRTAWFRNAQWGAFLHFLAIPPSTSETAGLNSDSWNRRVDAFDVKKLAEQMARLGAGYLGITLGQNSGYFCAPNAYYDRIVGAGFCSRRDLFADLADALRPYDIPLIGYLPSHAPMGCDQAIRALHCIPPWNFAQWGPLHQQKLAPEAVNDPRLTEFQRHWESVIAEWAVRWGNDLKGWWFDGCYETPPIYDAPEPPNADSFAAAARAGNPDAILAFNAGVHYPPPENLPTEDFLSGEINDPWQIPPSLSDADYRCQYHILTFAGQFWGSGPLRYSAAEMAAITAHINHHGGVVTWDLPFDQETGTLRQDELEKLCLFAATDRSRALPEMTFQVTQMPSATQPGQGTLTLNAPTEAVETAFLPPLQNLQITPHQPTACPLLLPSTPHNCMALLEIGTATLTRTFSYPIYQALTLGTTPIQRCPTINDVTAAEIALRADGNEAVISGNVFDEEIRISDVPWMGSCLELFIPDGARVRQYFLVPGAGVKSADRQQLAPQFPFETTMRQDGYAFSLRLPLALLGCHTQAGGRFELKISFHNHRHGYLHAMLWGVSRLFDPATYTMSIRVAEDHTGAPVPPGESSNIGQKLY